MKNQLLRPVVFLCIALCLLNSEVSGQTTTTPGLSNNVYAGPTRAAAQVQPKQKYALLVGISKYKRNRRIGDRGTANNWIDLNTEGDLELLAEVLIRKFEFKPENIKIIYNNDRKPIYLDGQKVEPVDPTGKLIADTFRTFITGQVKEGDIAYFHFSGHGQQIPDDNGDEFDGMDETIIPSDYASTRDGSKNIRDDEIAKWLEELSAKKPSNVTITLDSCFSGTGVRGGDEVVRGGPWMGEPIPPGKFREEDESVGDFVSRQRGGATRQNYVFLSAASPRQTATETRQNGQSFGAFTWALAQAMEKADKNTTYRDLFERVTDVMTQKQWAQTPQIEGTQTDKVVLDEGALPPQIYFSVKVDDGNPYLMGGQLNGVTAGSKFALYPQGAKEHKPGSELGILEINRVRSTTATFKLTADFSAEKIGQAARAFEVSHKYENVLKVAVLDPADASKLSKVFDGLGLTERVKVEDKTWDILIRRVSEAEKKDKKSDLRDYTGLLLQRRDGTILAKVADGEKPADDVNEVLLNEAKRQTIKNIQDTDSQIKIEIRIIPIETPDFDENEKGEITAVYSTPKDKAAPLATDRSGHYILKEKEWFQIEIRNVGNEAAYVTVLNLQSNGEISSKFPNNYGDNLIPGDSKWKRIDSLFRTKKPFGQESFKVIGTRTPTDFSPLIVKPTEAEIEAQRGETLDAIIRKLVEEKKKDTRGDDEAVKRVTNALESPLGRILIAAQAGKRADSFSPPAWSVATVTFFVVE